MVRELSIEYAIGAIKKYQIEKLSKNNFTNGISYSKNPRGTVWLQM